MHKLLSNSKLNRESTKITISEFYERYALGKYNFDPDYQRRGDVWSDDKQSFLIDSILKNYPMPPIFLHQIIDSSTGATIYNVIDGKQRLSAILAFISNKIETPSDYDVGAFGDSRLNGKKFDDLKDDLSEYKMQFWRYTLSIEYIETVDDDIINNVFDRLNRNGEPLEPQELRNAKYHQTKLLQLVQCLSKKINWKNIGKIKFNRMQDDEFVSELLFFLLEGNPMDASKRENIDEYYEKWSHDLSDSKANEVTDTFSSVINYIESLKIDYLKYKINGVSHFYALFGLAYHCTINHINSINVSHKLDNFYCELREARKCHVEVETYRATMQSSTRSKYQRDRRITALITFCVTCP